MMSPVSAGTKYPGSARWLPAAGTTDSTACASAILRMVSLKGPEALMTTLARMRTVRPVSLSLATTPCTLPGPDAEGASLMRSTTST